MISLRLELEPVAKGRPRATRQGHLYTPETTRRFENECRVHMKRLYRSKPIVGAIRVDLTFLLTPPKRKVRHFPTGRPDLDNYMKAVTDAGNDILWADDSQITECHARKLYSWVDRTPAIVISVTEIREDAT